MPLLLAISFISGLAAILAPCIWPLLPIVLSTATEGNKTKPTGVVLGIITSFTIFTLAVSFLVTLAGFNPEVLRKIASMILLVLGLSLIIPQAAARLEIIVGKISSLISLKTGRPNTANNFLGGYLTGLILGIVWSPCAAPILAIVAAISATQTVSLSQIVTILAFAAGLAVPLLVLTLGGATLIARSRFLSSYTGKIQQIFGVLVVATAAMIFFNLDRQLQAKILDLFPGYLDFLGKIEGLTNRKL